MPLLLLLLAALFVTAARPVAAQTTGRYSGRTVQDVRLQIEGTPAADQTLVDLVEVRSGEALSIAQVRESIQHLYSLGRFQDVQVAAEDGAGGGVVVTFNLIRLRSIERLVFRGQLGLSEGLLKSTIVERYGASPSLGRLDAATQTLQQLYADQGYLRAKVRVAAETQQQPERTVLAFDIDPGPRATIDAVEIAGDPRITRDALLRRLQASIGAPYLRGRLQARLDEYVRRLKEQRFYEAVGSLRAIESTDGSRVSLGVAINAGPLVNVRFAGDPIPRDRLEELAPIAREGSVEEDLLEDSESRIRAYLRHEGYWKADVTVARERGDTTLTIVFTITRGRQYRIAGPAVISGAKAIGVGELMALVPLKTGELFVESQLATAADNLRNHYRERGYLKADVKFAVNEQDSTGSEGLIRPAIAIVEGARATVGEITIAGNAAIPAGELRPIVQISTGDPYYEPRIAAARDALAVEYLNRGFAAVVVQPSTKPNADSTGIDLVFEIQEGPQTIVDHILIIGNEHTKAEVILRELQFRPGAPLGLQDQFESRRRLSALGLFRRVRIVDRPHGSSNEHDVLVTVEEAPATNYGYGAGVEGTPVLRATGEGGVAEQHFELAPRGFFDIGRNNLFGANRSVNLFTRIGFRRRNTPDPQEDTSRFGFTEYRVGATYRQPQWFGPNTLTVTAVVEQGSRTSFNFTRQSLIADVGRRLSPAVRISGRYALSSTRAFDEQFTSAEDESSIDRLFPRVRLSGFAGTISHDTRDDQFDPTRGMLLSGEGTVAARALGGEVGFMKGYVEALAFRPLLGSKRVVLATRAAIGMADGFERFVQKLDGAGNPIPGEQESVEDLPASERFFAGGDSTIRGYVLDSVGTPETIAANGFPSGGNALLLLSGELRFPVWRSVGAVVFVDGGNVFRRVTDFDAGELRGGVGFGLRYRSQVGTVRVDLGFKMDRREVRGTRERPTALHFSLGQAF